MKLQLPHKNIIVLDSSFYNTQHDVIYINRDIVKFDINFNISNWWNSISKQYDIDTFNLQTKLVYEIKPMSYSQNVNKTDDINNADLIVIPNLKITDILYLFDYSRTCDIYETQEYYILTRGNYKNDIKEYIRRNVHSASINVDELELLLTNTNITLIPSEMTNVLATVINKYDKCMLYDDYLKIINKSKPVITKEILNSIDQSNIDSFVSEILNYNVYTAEYSIKNIIQSAIKYHYAHINPILVSLFNLSDVNSRSLEYTELIRMLKEHPNNFDNDDLKTRLNSELNHKIGSRLLSTYDRFQFNFDVDFNIK